VRSRFLLLPTLIAMLGSGGGCNRNRRRTIAVIPKATSHLFWLSVQAGASAAGKELNVEIAAIMQAWIASLPAGMFPTLRFNRGPRR
jgi:ABC-type sugar transport system substrate-binding protein